MSKTLVKMFNELIKGIPFTKAEARYVPKIKSALEKQIPKKPIEDISKDYEGNIIDDVFFCPKCTRTICFGIENNLAENYPYCNCGQALDWSDTE